MEAFRNGIKIPGATQDAPYRSLVKMVAKLLHSALPDHGNRFDMKRKQTLTPCYLLSTWELKEYVSKNAPEDLKENFSIAFSQIDKLRIENLSISIICVRSNIQLMLDNLNDIKIKEQFKTIYKIN